MIRGAPTRKRLLSALSVTIAVVLVLLALLPATRLITVDSACMTDRIEATQDTTESVAVVGPSGPPYGAEETASPLPEIAIGSYESAVVTIHSYRGPPTRS